MVSISALRFPKQYQDAGLKGELPLLGGGTTFDEFVLPSLGDEAMGGDEPLIYSAALDTPINKRFVAEYREKFGRFRRTISETCYTTGRWINEAAQAVGGDVENRENFLGARVEIPTPPAAPSSSMLRQPDPEHLRPQGGATDGELWNTVVQTYPNVSQFWKYKPEEFLKQPVYDRTLRPARGGGGEWGGEGRAAGGEGGGWERGEWRGVVRSGRGPHRARVDFDEEW